jgi:hypothetical protein
MNSASWRFSVRPRWLQSRVVPTHLERFQTLQYAPSTSTDRYHNPISTKKHFHTNVDSSLHRNYKYLNNLSSEDFDASSIQMLQNG